MKVLKRAYQKNAQLDTDMYTTEDIIRMLNYHTVVWFRETKDENGIVKALERTYDTTNTSIYEINEAIEKGNIRVYLEDKKEIKVINIDGYYYTVVTLEDGSILYVKL